jgi:hypothetical protein
MKYYVYFSPCYGGHIGILTVFEDNFTRFDTEDRSGPCEGYPEFWGKPGTWVLLGEL